MRDVVSCSIGADSYSMILCDFSWGDIKKAYFYPPPLKRMLMKQRIPPRSTLVNQWGYCRLFIEGLVIQRQLYHQQKVPWATNLWTVLPMKSPTHRIDNSQKASLWEVPWADQPTVCLPQKAERASRGSLTSCEPWDSRSLMISQWSTLCVWRVCWATPPP